MRLTVMVLALFLVVALMFLDLYGTRKCENCDGIGELRSGKRCPICHGRGRL